MEVENSAIRMTTPERAHQGASRKPGIGATKKLPGQGFKRLWPPLIKMDETVKAKMEELFKA